MAIGALAVVGGGKEVTWGTNVAPTFYVPFSSEGFKVDVEGIQELQIRGLLDVDPKYKGMSMVSGSLSGVAYPSQIGHFLRAALGEPITSGVGPYNHAFTPTQTAFSALSGLPPYSFTVNRDAVHILRYAGCVCSKLGLKFSQGGILTFDTSWIGKNARAVIAPTVTLPTDAPFTVTGVVTRAAVAYAELQDFSIDIANSLEGEKLLNNTSEIARVSWTGKRAVTGSFTVNFANTTIYDDYIAYTAQAWIFTLAAGTSSIVISVPSLLITGGAPVIGGDGRVTFSASFEGQYDTGSSVATYITLTNSIASY